MEAVAQAKFVRYAPRKVNQVAGLIRNQSVEKAFEILTFVPKTVSTLIYKTLKSAVANSGKLKNFKTLKVKEVWIGQGPSLKRMRPGPQGRGMPYKRKMCHLTIVVSEMSSNEYKFLRRKNNKQNTTVDVKEA